MSKEKIPKNLQKLIGELKGDAHNRADIENPFKTLSFLAGFRPFKVKNIATSRDLNRTKNGKERTEKGVSKLDGELNPMSQAVKDRSQKGRNTLTKNRRDKAKKASDKNIDDTATPSYWLDRKKQNYQHLIIGTAAGSAGTAGIGLLAINTPAGKEALRRIIGDK